MGWENVSIEYLSSYLKQHGHQCSLAYEQNLFDDKNYVCMPFLAKLFSDPESVLEQIIKSNPQLIAFSVMTVQYEWALNLAHLVKKHCINIPIIFGGYHPLTAPDAVIKESVVDMICVGEGEHAMLALADAIEHNKSIRNIPGIWHKDTHGVIIKNGFAKPVSDLDSLPITDKDIFSKHAPMKTYLLSTLARGCIYNCDYCSVSQLNAIARQAGIKAFRIQRVDKVIFELKYFLKKYKYKWIDFRHAIFAFDHQWILDFCKKYKEEINRPFRIFMHPSLIRDDIVSALVDAKCFTIQMGVESFNEELRKNVLNRHESNQQILKAIHIMEKNKIHYTMDYILGLPEQTLQELEDVAKLFAGLKYCYRLSPFMCQYLPGSKMINYAVHKGEMSLADVEIINNGGHDNYMGEGSIAIFDKKKQQALRMYRALFRMMGLMPSWMRKLLIKSNIYKIILILPPFVPNIMIKSLDLLIIIQNRDARSYFFNYLWWVSRRFIPSHPTFLFRKRKLEIITNQSIEKTESTETTIEKAGILQ